MGLHVGRPQLAGRDYAGLDVHRVARVSAAGHGGQIVASNEAYSAIRSSNGEIGFIDLGKHRLKDLDAVEQLYQVVAPDLLVDFPPLRTAEARPHNIPSEMTDFVGRKEELAKIKSLLGHARLLTLTGPGGIGKTRLAIKVAAEVLGSFDDGAFFVPLASVTNALDVPSAIARTLRLGNADGRPADEALVEFLQDKKLLLVLDNLEHVLEAAALVGRLLASASGLRVLVTSRARLRLTGEQIYEVPPLPVRTPDSMAAMKDSDGGDAIDLFVRRVKSVVPDFDLAEGNLSAVTQIVNRLEGLPLAIELAAARCRLMPVQRLAASIDGQLSSFRSSTADQPDRFRTLRETVAWSYNLLNLADRALFRRLGVFVGGFTLEAAEYVAAGQPVDEVLESIASVIDNSLLCSRALHGEGRFSMLETIRGFAREELQMSGELQATCRQHKVFFLGMVEELEPRLTKRGQELATARLASDEANLRSALDFCLQSGDVETGLRMAGALWRFWQATGQMAEGRRWLAEFLPRSKGWQSAARAKALGAAASLAYWQGDYSAALDFYQEALGIYRLLRDRLNEADILFSISTASTWNGDAGTGAQLAAEARELFEALGARDKVGMIMMAQGFARWMEGDLEGARPLWEESRDIARETGDDVEAEVKRLAIASIDAALGRRDDALREAVSALDALVAQHNVTYTIMALDWVAAIASYKSPEAAARLGGAADRLRQEHGGGMRPSKSGLEDTREVCLRTHR